MWLPDGLTDSVKSELNKYNISEDKVKAAVKCDMISSTLFGTAWLIACDDCLCFLEEGNSFILKKYSQIDEIVTESYISAGCVMVRSGEEEQMLSHYTLTAAGKISKFVFIVNKLIKNEEIDDEELKKIHVADDKYINNGRKKLFFRVMSYVPKYKKELFIIIAIIILASIINLINPYLTGKILYDEVLTKGGRYEGKILELVLVLSGVSLTVVLLGILQGRIGASISGKIIYEIKTEVFEAMQKLGMKFFSSKRTGNLLNRINSDALDIQYFLNDGLPHFIINALTISCVGLMLFITNPVLSVTVLIPVPLIALIIWKSTRKFKKLKWHTWRSSSNMNSIINDTLLGIRVVKAFGKEEKEQSRFSVASTKLYQNRFREGIAAAKVFPLLSWIMAMGGFMVWAIGGVQVLGGKLSFGQLMSFVGYLSVLYGPVSSMVKTFDWWTNCMNSAQRIFEVIDREPDVPEAENPVHIEKIKGKVELRNVTFSYEPNKSVLKNVSFCVKPGEMVGLVGHSGAGKSTITNIITRLYDVNEGECLIDGVNVKDIKTEDLRASIGIVLQETFLFSGSVAENIAYGKPDATMEEIIFAAKKANAHGFITALPDGYETEIGKRGINLSGGEKQRISIARAILMDPAILILDEATSSLDTETERQIQEAVDTLVKGRTTIAIAHRLSTLKNAGRLIVVEKGRIVETGSHEELFAKENGIYANMAKKQIDAFKRITDGENYA